MTRILDRAICLAMLMSLLASFPVRAEDKAAEPEQASLVITSIRLPNIPILRVVATGVTDRDQRHEELEDRWFELKLQTCPELLYYADSRWSKEERITEHSARGVVTVNDRLRLVAGAQRSFFELDQEQAGNEKVSLTTFSLAANWLTGPRLRLVPELTTYTSRDAGGLGAALDAIWDVDENVSLRLGGKIFQPWQDNTLAVDNDGRFHNLTASLDVKFTSRLSGTLDVGRWWYAVGGKAPGGSARQGWRLDWGATLRYALWQNLERVFSLGFQDRSGLYEDSFSPGLFVYISSRRDMYYMRDQVPLVPIIPRSLDLRAGVEYNVALNRHWGLQADAYAGHDTLRKIPWQKLYGWNSRLVFVPKASARFWLEYRMDAASGSAVVNGREQTLSIGANFNF